MSNKLYISPYTEIGMIEMWGLILSASSTETSNEGGDQETAQAPWRRVY